MKRCSAGFAIGVCVTVLALLAVCLGAGYGMAGNHWISFSGNSTVFDGLRLQGSVAYTADGYRLTFDQDYGETRRAGFRYEADRAAAEDTIDPSSVDGPLYGDENGQSILSKASELSLDYRITVPPEATVYREWQEDHRYIYVDEDGRMSEKPSETARKQLIGYTVCRSVDRAQAQMLLYRGRMWSPVGEPLQLTEAFGELVVYHEYHIQTGEYGQQEAREGDCFLTVDGRHAFPSTFNPQYAWITVQPEETLYFCTAYGGRVYPGSGIYRLPLRSEMNIPNAAVRVDAAAPEAFRGFSAVGQQAVLVTDQGARVADLDDARVTAPIPFAADADSCDIVYSNGAACLRAGSAFLAVDLRRGVRLAGGELAHRDGNMTRFDAVYEDGCLYTLEYAAAFARMDHHIFGTAADGTRTEQTLLTAGAFPAVRVAAFRGDGAVQIGGEDCTAWLEAPGVLPPDAESVRLSLKLIRAKPGEGEDEG